MAGKHLSQDELQYVIDVKTAQAQQGIHKLEKQTTALRNENKQRLRQMVELEAKGKKETEQYKNLSAVYRETGQQIKKLTEKIKEQTRTLDTNVMTMSQLRNQAKSLQRELDNVSRTLNPELYNQLQGRLRSVTARMEELKISARGFKETFVNQSTLNYMAGMALTKGAELVGQFFGKMVSSYKDLIGKSVELAESADGITHAFERIGSKDYLQSLRQATKGTVTDIELMKAAVQAKDFHIPLEDLGKYLAFAQLKAQQTGQSLDYMVNSIVTGLGRESPRILDNLGLSATEISEKTKKTGDFMKAVAEIVENQLAEAGETYISASDRAAQRTVALENAQKELGDALLPLKEEFSDTYGQIKISIINVTKYLVEHRETIYTVGKAVALLIVTLMAYATAQKAAYLWSLRSVAASKLKSAAVAVENMMLQLSILRHAVLNKTMTLSIALQKAFNVVLKLSPWGLIFGGITLVVGALLLFNRRTDAAAKAQKKINDIKKEATRRTEEERIKIEMLTRRIHDNSLSLAERREAITELQKIVPDYTAKLSQEGKVYDENTSALSKYLNALKEKALLEGAEGSIKELVSQKADLLVQRTQLEEERNLLKKEQLQYLKDNANRPQTTGGAVTPTGVNASMNYASNISAKDKEISEVDKKIGVIDTTLSAIDKTFGKKLYNKNVKKNESTTDPNSVTAELDRIQQKIDKLKADRLTLKVGDTSGLKKIDKQIADLEKRKAYLENTTPSRASGADKIGKADKSSFNNNRQQDLATEKATYDKGLNLLKQDLINKVKTREEYDAAVQSLEIAHAANVLAIERDYTQKAKNLRIEDENEKKRIQLAQQTNEQQAEQAFQEKSLAARQQYFDALKQLQEKGMTDEQKAEADHQLQLASLEAFYKASLDYARKHGEDEKALTEAYEKAKAEITHKYEKQKADEKFQIRSQAGLVSQQELFNRELAQLKEKLAKEGLSEEEQQKAIANMTRQFEEDKLRIRQQYGVATQQELFDAELAQLKAHLDAKMISEEEYEKAVTNLKRDRWKADFDRYHDLFANAMKELQNAEIANMEAKYDAEIQAAQGSAEQVEKLEKEKANEKLKIQKKYADVNFAIQASQIIVNTAVSVMKAFSDLGPIAGAISGALISIAGTAQLAVANAERQKVKKMTLQGAGGSSASGARVATGLESGGVFDVEREQDGKTFRATYDPDRRGYIDRPTVLVGEGPVGHSKEWVASNAALENPTVAPVIDIIDRAQRVGDIRTLDMRKLMMQRGFASGGSISAPVSPAQSTAPATSTQPSEINEEFLSLLRELREKGIPAYVALDEFDAQQKIREQSRNIGKK